VDDDAGQRRAEDDCRALAHEESRVRLVRGPLPRRRPAVTAGRGDGDRRGGRAPAAYRSGLEADRSFVRCLRALMAGQGTPVVATTDECLLRVTAALAGRHARVAGSYELLLPDGAAVPLQHRLREQGETVRILVGWGRPPDIPTSSRHIRS
jgi:proline dehydrogenase